MVWIPLSHFLFYGFYQSLTYKEVKKVGVRTILFLLMDHFELVWFADFTYLCRRLAAPQHNIQASLMILLSVCIIFAED